MNEVHVANKGQDFVGCTIKMGDLEQELKINIVKYVSNDSC